MDRFINVMLVTMAIIIALPALVGMMWLFHVIISDMAGFVPAVLFNVMVLSSLVAPAIWDVDMRDIDAELF